MDDGYLYDFINMVGKNYNKIKNTFKKGIQKRGIIFDEDVFSCTLLKCHDKLSRRNINDDVALRYFWVSFRNNSMKISTMKRISIDMCAESSIDLIPNIVYNEKIDEICDIITEQLFQHYDKQLCNLWFEHIIYKKTYNELQAKSNINNLHHEFRKIRDYIRNKLPKINNKYKELIREIF